ncbi:MAG TPA: ribosome recycling factor [Acidimicrobiales bacterium]|jgi:ribosome recycling factor|nr:ribosome recycling factor [Acidimicrobiales bacterium]
MDDSLTALLLEDTKDKMAKAIEHVRAEFSTVRTGRANPALVEHLGVEYYGSTVPLQQLAQFSVPDARMLVISPYEKTVIGAIEKAITASDLGISPSNDGTVIRLSFPPLTEERRKDLVKVVRHKAEEGRVQIRNMRRHARQELEHDEKDQGVGADEVERFEKALDKMTHDEVAAVDALLTHKEQELLEV